MISRGDRLVRSGSNQPLSKFGLRSPGAERVVMDRRIHDDEASTRTKNAADAFEGRLRVVGIVERCIAYHCIHRLVCQRRKLQLALDQHEPNACSNVNASRAKADELTHYDTDRLPLVSFLRKPIRQPPCPAP